MASETERGAPTKVILRPYQLEAIQAVLQSNKRSVAIALPTGSGKTATAVGLCEHFANQSRRMLFVVPSIELMKQACGAFKTENKLGQGSTPDWFKLITVATVQSAQRNMQSIKDSGINTLIIDEAHHAIANSYAELTSLDQFTKIVSLSATMFRADGKRLADVVDEVVYEQDLHWAIEQGYLSKYRLLRPSQAHRLPRTTEKILVRKANGDEKIVERITYDHEERNRMVADLTHELWRTENRKCGLMFVNTIAHAEKMAQCLGPTWGWCSGENRAPLDDFRAGKLQGIVSVQLLLEGFDHPPADFLIVNGNIRGDDTGAIRWIQLLGRILRTHPGKEDALALDLSVCGLPDISYASDLDGSPESVEMTKAELELELAQSMTILERLEHPMLLTLEDLIHGLRQVKDRYRKIQEHLDTSLRLIPGKDGSYGVADSCWRIWQANNEWLAFDGKIRRKAATIRELEAEIDQKQYKSRAGKPTEKQWKLLERLKLKAEVINSMTRREASDFITTAMAQANAEPATRGQVWMLQKLYPNRDFTGLSKRQATGLIVQAKKVRS